MKQITHHRGQSLLLKRIGIAFLCMTFFSIQAENITIRTDVDTLYVFDDFDMSTSVLAGGNSGIGWADVWTENPGAPGIVNVNTENSLSFPSGSSLEATGGHLFTNEGDGGRAYSRQLTNSIALGARTTFYVSFLAQKTSAGSFRIDGGDGSYVRFSVGVESNGSLKVNAANQIVTSSQGLFENDKTYLVVARWDYANNQADLNMILFEEGEGIPESDAFLTWDHTDGGAAGRTGVVLEQFSLAFSSGGVMVDEFKVGSTWKSVTQRKGYVAPVKHIAKVFRDGVEQATYDSNTALSSAIAKVAELQTANSFAADTIYLEGTFTDASMLQLKSLANNNIKYVIKGEGRDKTFIQAFSAEEMVGDTASADAAFIYTSKSATGSDTVEVEFIDLCIRNVRLEESTNANASFAAVTLGAGTKATFDNVRFTNCDNQIALASVLKIPNGVISVDMDNCLIDNNKGKDGTAIYCYNLTGSEAINLTMTNSVIRDNVSIGNASGMRFWTQGVTPINIEIGNCVFYNNDAVANSSCLELLGAGIDIKVVNSTFADNLSVCDIYCTNNPKITLINNLFYGTNQGGAANVIYNAGATFTPDNLILKNTIMETIDVSYFSGISPENCVFNESIAPYMEAINNDHKIIPKKECIVVDAGVEYPPYTDGFLGAGPDVGAYQSTYVFADLLPQRPNSLFFSNPSETTIQLNWNGGSIRGGCVILQNGMPIDSVNTINYTVTDIEDDMQYEFGIYVYNALGNSDTVYATSFGKCTSYEIPLADDSIPELTGFSPEINIWYNTADSNIVIVFDRAMNTLSVEGSISISPIVSNPVFSWNENTLTISADNYVSSTAYTVTVGKNSEDVAGNYMLSDYSSSFTIDNINRTSQLLVSDMSFYPNPVEDYLNISPENSYHWKVYSTDGRFCMQGIGSTIPTHHLERGHYLVWLLDNAGQSISINKFVK